MFPLLLTFCILWCFMMYCVCCNHSLSLCYLYAVSIWMKIINNNIAKKMEYFVVVVVFITIHGILKFSFIILDKIMFNLSYAKYLIAICSVDIATVATHAVISQYWWWKIKNYFCYCCCLSVFSSWVFSSFHFCVAFMLFVFQWYAENQGGICSNIRYVLENKTKLEKIHFATRCFTRI